MGLIALKSWKLTLIRKVEFNVARGINNQCLKYVIQGEKREGECGQGENYVCRLAAMSADTCLIQ